MAWILGALVDILAESINSRALEAVAAVTDRAVVLDSARAGATLNALAWIYRDKIGLLKHSFLIILNFLTNASEVIFLASEISSAVDILLALNLVTADIGISGVSSMLEGASAVRLMVDDTAGGSFDAERNLARV